MADGPRFPLPGLLLALLLAGLVHGPLVRAPPFFDEAPFLAGLSEGRGAALGMQWLDVEVALLGREPLAHRCFALALEVALLIAMACWLKRRSAAANLALVAFAAYLIHPARTESFVRLGARGVLVSELLLVAGFMLAWTTQKLGSRIAGLLLLAAGASGLPAVAAFALPLLFVSGDDRAETQTLLRAHPKAAPLIAVALLAGTLLSFLARTPAAPWPSGLAGLDLLARPWAIGLVQPVAGSVAGASAAGSAIALLLVGARWLRDRGAAASCIAALVACAAGPALRPPRTGLESFAATISADAFLPALALLLVATWQLARSPLRWAKLPLLAATVVSSASGLVHSRSFESPIALLDHSIRVAPEQLELRVMRAQRYLLAASVVEPQQQHLFATEALDSARRVLRRRSDDDAAATLLSLALAMLGRLDEARAQSDEVLARHPENWFALAGRSELEALAGDDLGALRWLRAARNVGHDPTLAVRYGDLIELVWRQIATDLTARRFDAVREQCRRLLEIAPEEIEARETIADCYRLEGDLPKAVEELERLHAELPRRRTTVQRLASLYDQLHDAQKADAYARLLLELPPDAERSRR